MTAAPDNLETLLAALTEKQRRWVQAYPGEAKGNATRASEIAGYSGGPATWAVAGYENLRNPKITAVLAAFLEGDPLTASRIEHQHFLTRVMRGEEKEKRFVRDQEGNGSFEDCPPSLRDRLVAQEALAKLGGYHVTKVAPVNSNGEDLRDVPWDQLLAVAGAKVGM